MPCASTLSRETEHRVAPMATARTTAESGQKSHELGLLMCEATEQLLWTPAQHWILEQQPKARLQCMVGRGKATYHRRDAHQPIHRIVYGQRMIAAKQNSATAEGWLSLREIRRRHYYSGQCSTLNLLAHTCCHEFAHLLQSIAGQRYRGSVHNRHFYDILDGLHGSGAANEVRRWLGEETARRGWSELATEFVPTPSPAAQWQVGDRVNFGEGRRQRTGTIIRLNPRTCTVEGCGLWQRQRYRVPYALLSTADDNQ